MTLLEIGGILYEKGDYEGAEVLYSEMLQYEMQPELKSKILFLRADTLWKQGDFEAALADYSQAEQLGYQAPEILNQLCWILGITAQPALALPFCERAVSGEPIPSRRDSRGLVYAQLGRTGEAIADFQAVVDDLKDETSPDLKKVRAERQQWLADLQAGQNPITPEVLAQLREDDTHESVPLWQPGSEADRTRAVLMEAATRAGFTFDPVAEIEGQEAVIGKMSDEGCLAELSLIGPEAGLKGATLILAGCPDDFQSSFVEWFMNSFLLTHADEIKATVWQITDIYYVIEGVQTEQVTREIGDVTFTAEQLPGSPPKFQLTALVGE